MLTRKVNNKPTDRNRALGKQGKDIVVRLFSARLYGIGKKC